MLGGNQAPTFSGCLVRRGERGLFAGARQIGIYEVLEHKYYGPSSVRGVSTDGTIEVIGDHINEVAQAIWLIEQGKRGRG
jgi:hypothetical protein